MNYDDLKDRLVTPLLKKYGKQCYVVTPTPLTGWRQVYNPGESRLEWVDGSGNVSVDPPKVKQKATYGVCVEKRYEAREINGTTILQGDRRFMVSPDITPVVGGFFYVGDAQLKIIAVYKLSPALINLVWELQCRE